MADQPFVLGVDLDGVCGDYTAAFRRGRGRRARGSTSDSLPLERSWDFHEWGLGPATTSASTASPCSTAASSGRCRSSTARPNRCGGSPTPVCGSASSRTGCTSTGATPPRSPTPWRGSTRPRIPYRDICFLGAKPEVEADAYVDDGPHNVIALRAAGNDVIVFDQPYNRASRRATSARVARGRGRSSRSSPRPRARACNGSSPGFDAGADRIERRRGAPPID